MAAATRMVKTEKTKPIEERTLLPSTIEQKHICDSYSIRMHPKKKYTNFAVPPGYENSRTDHMALAHRGFKIDNKLNKLKKKLVETVRETSAKWKHLERNEKQLKYFFIEFNNFIQKNAENRKKFLMHTKELEEQIQILSVGVEFLRLELEKCKILRQLLEIETKKHSIYGSFLEKVVEETHCFSSTRNLLNSFEMMLEDLERTTENFEHTALEMEEKEREMQTLFFNKESFLLDLHLRFNCLSERFYEIRRKNMYNENLVFSICANINETALKYGECVQSIDSLYGYICERLKTKRIFPKDDYKNQLNFMKIAFMMSSGLKRS